MDYRRFSQQLIFLCDERYRNSCCSVVNFCQRLQQSVQDYLNLGKFSKNILNIICCFDFFYLHLKQILSTDVYVYGKDNKIL